MRGLERGSGGTLFARSFHHNYLYRVHVSDLKKKQQRSNLKKNLKLVVGYYVRIDAQFCVIQCCNYRSNLFSLEIMFPIASYYQRID